MKQEDLFSHARSAEFGAALFLIFVLAGSAYIVWAKLIGVPALYVTSVPLALMLLYAGTLALARYFRLRDDQAGDNLYYLGFLYTLTSLGVSLWQFSPKDGGDTIVTNFGVAIASTILGVALRVVFNQLRQDPLEVERVARLELADAARRVKQELDSTTFEFAGFRRATRQMLEESAREKRESSERLANELFGNLADLPNRLALPLEQAAGKSRDTIETLAKAVLDRLKNTGQALVTQENTLATATAGLATSLQELETKLKSMQSPEGIIEIKLQPFIRGFTQAVNTHSKATGAQVAELQKVIGQFGLSVQELSEQIAAAGRDRTANEQTLRDLAGKMHADAAEVGRLLTQLTETLSATPGIGGRRRSWLFWGGSP